MKVYKLLPCLTLLFFSLTCFSQRTYSPEQPKSAKKKAEYMVHELEKACQIFDKADLSEVYTACLVYCISLTEEGVAESEERIDDLIKEMSRSIRRTLTMSQAKSYKAWETERREWIAYVER